MSIVDWRISSIHTEIFVTDIVVLFDPPRDFIFKEPENFLIFYGLWFFEDWDTFLPYLKDLFKDFSAIRVASKSMNVYRYGFSEEMYPEVSEEM